VVVELVHEPAIAGRRSGELARPRCAAPTGGGRARPRPTNCRKTRRLAYSKSFAGRADDHEYALQAGRWPRRGPSTRPSSSWERMELRQTFSGPGRGTWTGAPRYLRHTRGMTRFRFQSMPRNRAQRRRRSGICSGSAVLVCGGCGPGRSLLSSRTSGERGNRMPRLIVGRKLRSIAGLCVKAGRRHLWIDRID